MRGRASCIRPVPWAGASRTIEEAAGYTMPAGRRGHRDCRCSRRVSSTARHVPVPAVSFCRRVVVPSWCCATLPFAMCHLPFATPLPLLLQSSAQLLRAFPIHPRANNSGTRCTPVLLSFCRPHCDAHTSTSTCTSTSTSTCTRGHLDIAVPLTFGQPRRPMTSPSLCDRLLAASCNGPAFFCGDCVSAHPWNPQQPSTCALHRPLVPAEHGRYFPVPLFPLGNRQTAGCT